MKYFSFGFCELTQSLYESPFLHVMLMCAFLGICILWQFLSVFRLVKFVVDFNVQDSFSGPISAHCQCGQDHEEVDSTVRKGKLQTK